MTEVSVIIPTWNRAASIQRAVMSALNQTYRPAEVLVCDDGSTDNTKDIVCAFNNPILKWIPGPRCGWPSFPRNRGIRQSKGQWVAFLDSDDVWLPRKLEIQLSVARKLKCRAVSSQAYRYVPAKGISGQFLKWGKQRIAFDDLLVENQVVCSSVLIEKNLLERVKGFPEDTNVIEDYALWLRVCTQTDFAFVNEPLLIYTEDLPNSIGGSIKMNDLTKKKFVLKDFLQWAYAQKSTNQFIDKAEKKHREICRTMRKKKLKRVYTWLRDSIQ